MNIRVDPRKVKVVEMKDGTRYPVERNGTVAITNARHAAEVAHNPAGTHDVAETGFLLTRIGFVNTPERTCPDCAFAAWPWQQTCPRCGAAL